jgi:membrane associated rhomboid family serine protease
MIPIRDINPTRNTPWMTWGLLLLNVVAFAWQVLGGAPDAVVKAWGFIAGRFLRDPLGDWPTLLTSMFLHGGLFHLSSNLLYLWVFGDNVEDRLGKLRFFLFYLLAGVFGALGQMLIEPTSLVPMVGASGAIAGVLGAYFLLYPGARVVTIIPPLFFWPFELPAWVLIATWFLLQVFHGVASLASSAQVGVAFFAHIGGFLAGLWLTRYLLPPAPPPRVIRVVIR